MLIAEDTRLEVEYALNNSHYYPEGYIDFTFKWMAFNRVYNDSEQGGDKEKVLSFGEKHSTRWDGVCDLAIELASLECIGGERVPGNPLLKPKGEVKSATLFLRQKLGLDTTPNPADCTFTGCNRLEKRYLCNQVQAPAWTKSEVAALLRLVYQVRCSLIHGEKHLAMENPQFNRDRQLVYLSNLVMDRVLTWIIDDNKE